MSIVFETSSKIILQGSVFADKSMNKQICILYLVSLCIPYWGWPFLGGGGGGGCNCCRFCWSFLNCAKTIKAINLKVYHFSWKWSEYIFWIFKNVWSNFWSCKYMFTSLLWNYIIDISSTFHLRKTEKKNFFCQEFSKRHKILGFTAVSRNGLHIWWCR